MTRHKRCQRLGSVSLGEDQSQMESTLSTLVAGAEQGDRAAAGALFAALYSELHRVAKRELGRHGFAVTLGATTLLLDAGQRVAWLASIREQNAALAADLETLLADYRALQEERFLDQPPGSVHATMTG